MKNNHKALLDALCRRLSTRASVETGVFVLLVAMTAVSAAMVKEASHLPALASVAQPGADRTNASIIVAANRTPAANTTAAEPIRQQ